MHRNALRLSCNLLALLLFVGGFALLALGLRTQEKEERDLLVQRQEWFYRQRAYPHEYVPTGARQRALKQLEQKRTEEEATRALLPLSALAAIPSWTFIGPEPISTPYTDPVVSGRVSALAIDPGDVNTVYLGGAQGGVWKTTDGGNSWTPLTDTQASTAIGSIALDPSNSKTIYVGTGEENFSGDSYFGAGILKSTDGGTTWTQFCGAFCGPVGQDGYYGGGARIGGLAVHPTNGQILLAAVALLNKDGIYRSTDGGNTWTQVVSGNPGNSVIFDPTNGNIAYASLGNSFSGGTEGVFKSTDSGQTWVALNGTGANVLNLTNAGRIVLAMALSSSTTLYAGIANVVTGDLLGFFKTTDGGTNWTQLTSTPDYCTPQCSYDHVIAVQPTNPNVVFAGGAFVTTLVRSLDGGSSWTTLQSAQNFGFLHADMHALAFFPDGNTLYLGNDGGAYVTTQITANNPSFTALNSNLALTQFYPGLSINPTNAAIAIGGSQDNGTVIYSGALTWNDVVCGDGGYTAIDFITPATLYAACQKFNIFKSTSNGASGSWNVVLNGINTGDRVDYIPPLVMDPSNSQTLYFGTDRVYQTLNGASSWTVISPDLTGGDSFFGVLSTIAVAPNNSNMVYVGTMDSRVQVTTNAGSGTSAIWTNVSAGLPPRVVTHVAVDPTTSTTAYATFSGFTGFGDSLGHVFKTTNRGSTWTDISSDLPNTPVNFLVIDPDAPSTLFAATDVGVFYTTTSGTSWTSMVVGLPRIAVLGLTLHNPSRTLRASTHGRGAWDINIAGLPPTPTPTPQPDFNGDHKPDILWQDNSTGERAIWFMNGTTHAGGVDLGRIPLEWKIASTGDFNGDGKTDIVWQDASTGTCSVWLMNGTTVTGAADIAHVPAQWQIAAAADFNGDGKPDILWQNTATGERAIWLMNGTSYASGVSLGVVPTQWQIVGTGDFNGDGQTDILWQNTSTGDRAIWFMHGTALASGIVFVNVPIQWRIAGTGDFNGDGKTDILWQNTSTGERAIWLMNGSAHSGNASLGTVPVQWEMRNH